MVKISLQNSARKVVFFGGAPTGVKVTWSFNAAVNGHLELTLLKDRQRFDAVSTSNLEVYKFRDWWILTYFIFGHDESSTNYIWSKVILNERAFYCFLIFFILKWILT